MSEITAYIDVAQIVLYAFWVFFAVLIVYLRREDKREGYPLDSDRTDRSPRVKVVGWPMPPEPKAYILPGDQGVRLAPHPEERSRDVPGTRPVGGYFGAPLVPTGDPMVDGVGPASYPTRDDLPDLAVDGQPKIMPMRMAEGFHIEERNPDPRGMRVIGADGQVAGVVKELWVDRAEHRILFFEVELTGAGHDSMAHNPLLPYGFASVKFGKREIRVASIMAKQFGNVPRTASDQQVTRLEEDRITAYYSSGHLYAKPSRQEPLI
ncbi:MAG: photosynthetic reaction center subunit H [Pseudomonadota bacterium]